MGLLAATTACGDLGDAVLESVSVQADGQTVQTLDVDLSGNNFFENPVPTNSTFVISYDEPIDLTTAREHIYLNDAVGSSLGIQVSQRLTDVIVTPAQPMVAGQNHTLLIEAGIDDVSGNTDHDSYYISLYVE